MATNGIFGFIKDGKTKATYNHSDSFLYDLGESIVEFINSTTLDEMKEIFNGLIMVDEDESLSTEIINECKQIIEEHGDMFIHYREMLEMSSSPEYKKVIEQVHYPYSDLIYKPNGQHNWYTLLRPTQGGLNAWKHGLKYMIDSSDSVGKMNYTYLLDLDKEQMIIYEDDSVIHEIPFNTLKGTTLMKVIGDEEE